MILERIRKSTWRASVYPIDRRVATDAAWACALGPEALPDLEPVLELARLAQASSWVANRPTLGALLYRAGQYREAVTELNEVIWLNRRGGTWADFLFLALAQQRLGQTEDARRALKSARFLLDAEAPVRQATHLLGGGMAGPLSATAAAAATQPSLRPRWDALTRLEVRILRREAEEALREPGR
jgi:hypothetical protein